MTMSDRSLSVEQERDVLGFDPWGDRDATYTLLRQAFVETRRLHECSICFDIIGVKVKAWARTESDDGTVKTFYFCPECCWAIAHRYDEDVDGFERMYERWEIGQKRVRGSAS